MQCGYCIPGMILTAKAYLDERPAAERGARSARRCRATLCRCTGYQKIVDAVCCGAPAERVAGQAVSAHEHDDARRRQVAHPHRRAGKVTGRHVYAADFALPGMLFGKILRSAEPHARLVTLDVAKALRDARRARGHHRRRRPADVRYGAARQGRAGVRRGRWSASRASPWPRSPRPRLETAEAALAGDRGRVRAAARRCSISRTALPPGAPLVHEGWSRLRRAARSSTARATSAIAPRIVRRRRRGGLRGGRPRLRAPLHHRRCTRATPSRARPWRQWDGTARSSSGRTRSFRSTCRTRWPRCSPSAALARSASSCRASAAASAASCASASSTSPRWLARKSGRPVKVMTTSEEELTAAYPRQPTVVDAEDRRDAATAAAGPPGAGLLRHAAPSRARGPAWRRWRRWCWPGPYRTPNLLLEGYAVYTNKTQLRLVPRAVGAAGEFRRRIADGHHRRRARHRSARAAPAQHRPRGRRGADGPGADRASASRSACARRPTRSAGRSAGPAPGRGKGIACGWWTTTGGSSGVYVKINPDGTVALNTGAVGDRHGRAHRRGAGPGRGARRRSGRHQRRLRRHASRRRTTTARRAAARRSRSATPAGPRRRICGDRSSRSGGAAARRCRETRSRCATSASSAPTGACRSPSSPRCRRSPGGGLIAHGTSSRRGPPYDPKRVEGHA